MAENIHSELLLRDQSNKNAIFKKWVPNNITKNMAPLSFTEDITWSSEEQLL